MTGEGIALCMEVLVRPLHSHWLHLITAPTTALSTNLH